MNRRQQQSQADTIAGVKLARLFLLGCAVALAWRGEWAGAGIMGTVWLLAWLALPVTEQ